MGGIGGCYTDDVACEDFSISISISVMDLKH